MKYWLVQLLKYFIVPGLLGLCLFLMAYLLVRQYIKLHLETRVKFLEEELDQLFLELIFKKNNLAWRKVLVEDFKIRVPLHKKWCQDVVLEKLLGLERDFNLDKAVYQEIFSLFGFEDLIYGMLRHKSWHYKSRAIEQLRILKGNSGAMAAIAPYLTHDKVELKSDALAALLAISPESIVQLENLKRELSIGGQIKVLAAIFQNYKHIPSNIQQLITSNNNSVVVLAIKLMVRYKHPMHKNQLAQLLKSDAPRVRKEAIIAAGRLKMYEAKGMLLLFYKIQSQLSKYFRMKEKRTEAISVFKSLAILGSFDDLKQIWALLQKETDQQVQIAMIQCINTIDPSFMDQMKETNANIQEMILHLNDSHY